MGESTHSLSGTPPSHLAVAGHFPGHPIVPGAVILAHVWERLAQCRTDEVRRFEFAAVKLLLPLGPDESVAIRLVREPEEDLRVTVCSGCVRIASGVFRRHRAPASDVDP